ncbi:MAG: methyltransferase domain-containing protein [Chloroflexi bacterium]|nr:methyltransferase domain-containing protein [Chloroflexota bacterium]
MDSEAGGEHRLGAVANVEMTRAWDGEEGERWAEHASRYDASARRYGVRLLDAAGILTGERVLDIGCGCGETTRQAALRSETGETLGVDLSGPMLAVARQRSQADGISNARFVQADAQVYPFERQTFDLAISRFGAMFFDDPVAAFRNIRGALRPGARLALLAWQEPRRNEWMLAIRDALAMGRTLPEPPLGVPGPFGLAQPDDVRRFLRKAGFEDVALEDVAEPMYLGADADDAYNWAHTIGPVKGLTEQLDEAAKARALENLRMALNAHETSEGVLLGSRAWLIAALRG